MAGSPAQRRLAGRLLAVSLLCPLFFFMTAQAGDPASSPAPSTPVRPATVREPDQTIHLWQEGGWKGSLPDGWKTEGPEKAEPTGHMGGILTLKNISDPVLVHYAPDRNVPPTGTGVIICPGGGYHILAWDHEGTEVADWLSRRGHHAWVLKYRLPRPGTADVRHHAALQDAQRAISLLRHRAADLRLDSARLGILGFSAGGHLAALTSVSGDRRAYPPRDEIDKASCRPDFTALIYPAYLAKSGDQPGLVPGPGSPPAFLVHSADDALTWRNSLTWFEGLRENSIRAELHIFPDGGHGYGMRSPLSPKIWPDLLAGWLIK